MTGKAVALSEVPDDVFSQKVLGDGIAIIPNDGEVKSPVAGKVMVVSETKHAYALQTDTGLEILIHIGLDTVKLNGKGFTAKVKAGDYVDQGTVLCNVDKELYTNEKNPLYTPVLITNVAQLKEMETITGNVTKGKTEIIKYK
ncbi:MAG: PTS glucose transporter subunit IIA [Lachnospiraceae bacterium]|nr:PTS glucose transporter subunit IIA [Lachnospiraceae bacterium]